MQGSIKEIAIIDKNVISTLEAGIAIEGVDSVIRMGVHRHAMGVALLLAAEKLDQIKIPSLKAHIDAFEHAALEQEKTSAENIEILNNKQHSLGKQEVVDIETRIAALDKNAGYIREVAFAATNYFVDHILSDRRLKRIAQKLGRVERARLRNRIERSGFTLINGVAEIQY